ncbi:MAG: penicillin acylase family protein [Pseudomonadota bacterium]
MHKALQYLTTLALIVGAIAALAWLALPTINERKTSGELELRALDSSVRIVRDSYGIPYIYASSLDDALRAQGFVAGQDRLFQMEGAKRAATGRLAEIFGAGTDGAVLKLDREARTIGFHRLAQRQLGLLLPSARAQLTAYTEGLNAYITTRAETHPLEFRLAAFEPEPWTEADLLAIAFYLGWASAANFDAELIAHQVIEAIGESAFEEIAPLTVNPDDAESERLRGVRREISAPQSARIAAPAAWTRQGIRQQGIGGSNNWAVSGKKAGLPAAVVTNDPHLDSRVLPGLWHPVGIITPDLRLVGVSAGLPGIVIGRNANVAFGVTNAYADAVDLYIETLDPANTEHYLEGDVSIPFRLITERIRIKDGEADGGFQEELLEVRFTRRGPVITDHAPSGGSDAVMSMRWASAEFMGETFGLDTLMFATTIDDALAAVAQTSVISLNFVVGDSTGRIGRRASGAAPVRLRGDGMTPFPINDAIDNWGGRIPATDMPGETDPERGWTGTANHMTAPADYPWVYTTYASPAYRYERMQEILAAPQVSADDAWNAQYDSLNVFARDLAPILARALQAANAPELVEMGDQLASWGYHDDAALLAPTLFHALIRELALATFEDEMGTETAAAYLSSWYLWQQRFDAMVQAGSSHWFDDKRTVEVEDLPALIRRAATQALASLGETHGDARTNWLWGKVHQIDFSGPLRLDGFLGKLTGNQSVAMSGSGETLLRALYPFDQPFNSKWFASLRMTADLNDSEKVRAVLPGGAVGRTFHPQLSDQTPHWQNPETELYWWFSDEAIAANAQATLTLTPKAN